MKKNQSGFSIVEILLVVLVVGLLGTIGWLVYDRMATENDRTSAETSRSTKQESKTPKDSQPALEKTTFKTFEVTHDGAWKVTERVSDPAQCADGKTREKLELKKEQKTIVILVNECGRDFPSDAMMKFGVTDGKVTIPSKSITVCTLEGDEGGFCTSGDDQLTVGGGLGEYDEAKNNYFLYFHNAASEDTSLATLADIYEVIESIKLTR